MTPPNASAEGSARLVQLHRYQRRPGSRRPRRLGLGNGETNCLARSIGATTSGSMWPAPAPLASSSRIRESSRRLQAVTRHAARQYFWVVRVGLNTRPQQGQDTTVLTAGNAWAERSTNVPAPTTTRRPIAALTRGRRLCATYFARLIAKARGFERSCSTRQSFGRGLGPNQRRSGLPDGPPTAFEANNRSVRTRRADQLIGATAGAAREQADADARR